MFLSRAEADYHLKCFYLVLFWVSLAHSHTDTKEPIHLLMLAIRSSHCGTKTLEPSWAKCKDKYYIYCGSPGTQRTMAAPPFSLPNGERRGSVFGLIINPSLLQVTWLIAHPLVGRLPTTILLQQ